MIHTDGREEVTTVRAKHIEGAIRAALDIMGGTMVKGRLRILCRFPGGGDLREHDLYFGFHGKPNPAALALFNASMDMQGGEAGYQRQIVRAFHGPVVIFEQDVWG